MFYSLENEFLNLKFRSFGGELCSIQDKDGTEYIWNGDETWWKFCSPILFPIVGSLRNGKYKLNGKTYELGNHGFSRTSEFKLVDKTDKSIEFELRYSEDTLKCYPFKFALRLGYELEGKNIKVKWTVQNLDDKEMFFQIGAHPALRTFRNDNESFEGYYLDFGTPQDSQTIEVDPHVYLLHTKKDDLKGQNYSLDYDKFKGGVHIYNDLKTDTITLRNKYNKKAISLKFPGFPFLGIWTPERGGAPFICVEPWFGHADYADYDGEFSDREGTQRLNAGKRFETSYSIIVD